MKNMIAEATASSNGPRSRSPFKRSSDLSSPSSAPLDLNTALSANITSLSPSRSNVPFGAGNMEHQPFNGQGWHSNSHLNELQVNGKKNGNNFYQGVHKSYSSASTLSRGGDTSSSNGDLHPLIATAPSSGGVSPRQPLNTMSNGVVQSQKKRRRSKGRSIPFFVIFLISCIGGATFLIISSIYLTTYDGLSTETATTPKHQRSQSFSQTIAKFAGKSLLRNGSGGGSHNFPSVGSTSDLSVDSALEDLESSKLQASRLEKIESLKKEAQEAKKKEEENAKTAKDGGDSVIDEPQWPSIPPPLPGSTREKGGDTGDKDLYENDGLSFLLPGVNQTKHGLSDTAIPQYLWFTDKTDILKTKKPVHFYENVVKTINMYSNAFTQTPASVEKNGTSSVDEETLDDNDIRVTCMDNEYCDKIISHVAPELVQYFHKEERGDYKADMCRLAALYLHGGYYFDIDIDIIEPVVHAEIVRELKQGSDGAQPPQERHDVTFSTAVDLKGIGFFQAFMAASPRHPVIKMAMKVIELYYKSSYRALKGPHTPMGPMTLAAAYKLVVGEPVGSEIGSGPGGVMKPNKKQKPSPDSVDSSEFLIAMTGKNRPEKEIENYKRFMFTLAQQKVILTNDERWAIYNSTLFLKESQLQQGMYPDLPRKKGNMFCNMIVHDPIGKIPYFYSRIAGSQNCQHNICGGGYVGNGKCENPKECCSPSGWCGTTPAHCNKRTVQNKIFQSLRPDFNTGEGWCGEGRLGNGTCAFADLCCSASGWCGTSSQHCRGYCGNGRIGNGKCRATTSNGTPPCCSPSGWCGTTPAHCSSSVSSHVDKPTNPIDKNAPCGNGNKGNGQCADPKLCCSPSGWCGISAAHCRSPALSPQSVSSGGNKDEAEQTVYCGNGKLGNGKCEEAGLCCSPSGWCGKTAAHCKRTECGNGIVGNGQCADPTLCCSPSGWCGKTPAHCSSRHQQKK